MLLSKLLLLLTLAVTAGRAVLAPATNAAAFTMYKTVFSPCFAAAVAVSICMVLYFVGVIVDLSLPKSLLKLVLQVFNITSLHSPLQASAGR